MFSREKVGTTEVTVAVTPNGHADAVNGNKFVMPEERMMTFGDFLDIISTSDISSKPPGVFYVQKQNSNMTDEFKELLEDVEEEISWASQALSMINFCVICFSLVEKKRKIIPGICIRKKYN